MLQKILDWFKSLRSNDPVYSCIVYKRHGCSHLDGVLCDIKTCDILKEYKLAELEQQLNIALKDRLSVKGAAGMIVDLETFKSIVQL